MADRGSHFVLALALLASACSFDPSGEAPAGGQPADAGTPASGRADAAPRPAIPDAAPPVALEGHVASERGTPELDGETNEWEGVPSHEFDMASASHRHDAHPGYRPSASVVFRSMYDDRYLYFLIEVSDDIVSDSRSPLYDDDSVSLYLDARGDRSGPYGEDDHEIVIGPGGRYADYADGDAELVGTATSFAGGWRLEIGVDRSTLDGDPRASVLGFSLAFNDDDGIGSPAIDGYGAWYYADVAPCPSCCEAASHPELWCDTRQLGTLELAP